MSFLILFQPIKSNDLPTEADESLNQVKYCADR